MVLAVPQAELGRTGRRNLRSDRDNARLSRPPPFAGIAGLTDDEAGTCNTGGPQDSGMTRRLALMRFASRSTAEARRLQCGVPVRTRSRLTDQRLSDGGSPRSDRKASYELGTFPDSQVARFSRQSTFP